MSNFALSGNLDPDLELHYRAVLDCEVARGLELGELDVTKLRVNDLGWLARNVMIRNKTPRAAVIAFLAAALSGAPTLDFPRS